ncbi:MAG: hypothetical protein ACPLRN_00595 [Microgenomates group bacterium]
MENQQLPVNRSFFSYCLYPQIKFETYEEGEKIILLLRAHPITYFSVIFNVVIFLLIIFASNFFLVYLLNSSQVFIVNLFAVVFVFSYIFFNFLNWYFNVGIVTNKRVIDIDFNNVLYKEVSSAQLDKIEDITVKSGGYFEAFFNYGDIYIQTAGAVDYIEFSNVPFPSEAVETINKLLAKKHGH